jgi:hypothetical protein
MRPQTQVKLAKRIRNPSPGPPRLVKAPAAGHPLPQGLWNVDDSRGADYVSLAQIGQTS